MSYTEDELSTVASSLELSVLNLPMSPSSNSQYALIRRGTKTFFVSSSELQTYKRHMAAYKRQNLAHVNAVQKQMQGWLVGGMKLGIKTVFHFERSRLFTQKETIKKLDVSNRIKAVHDCFCTMVKIDDSNFFEVIALKKWVHNKGEERVDLYIYPIIEDN